MFKNSDQILIPDGRFTDQYLLSAAGKWPVTLADHHGLIQTMELSARVPDVVHAAFDRARHALLYAWFSYDLLTVGEAQALNALELALKLRLAAGGWAGKKGGLGRLVEKARRFALLPPRSEHFGADIDPATALVFIRNELVHGTTDVHSPGMAIEVVKSCASVINEIFEHGQQATAPGRLPDAESA